MEHRPAIAVLLQLIVFLVAGCAATDNGGQSPAAEHGQLATAAPSVLPPVAPASPVPVANCTDSAPAPLVTNVDPALVPASALQPVANEAAAASLARDDTAWLGGSNVVSQSAPAAAQLMSYGRYLALRAQPADEASVSSARCVWAVTVTAKVTRTRGPLGTAPTTYDSFTVVLDAATGLTVNATAPGVPLK